MITGEIEYFRPATVKEAVELLVKWGERGVALAGGTDLLLAMKRGELAPDALIDVARLVELSVLVNESGWLRIGAAVPFERIASSDIVRRYAPALASSAAEIGSPQIRARGTLGGNIVTASPAGDSLPALVAHDAEVVTEDRDGQRTSPLESFLEERETGKRAGELLREVRIPVRQDEQLTGAFVKLGRRNALAIARMSAALVLRRDEHGALKGACLVLGAVAPRPLRVPVPASVVSGFDGQETILAQLAAEAVAKSIPGRPSASYKTRAVKGVVLEAFYKVKNGG